MSKKNNQPKTQVKIHSSNDTLIRPTSQPIKTLSKAKETGIFIGVSLFLFSIIYRKFLFGKFVFLFKDIGSDSYNYTYPLFSYYAQQLKTGNIPQWTFQHGLGQNLHPFWFGPIRIVLWWIFDGNIAESMVYLQITHLVLAGLFFFLFLRLLNRSFITAITFGLLFAFSGYATIGGSWSPEVFPQEVLQMSFLLYATQLFLSKNKYFYLPFAIALIAIYQPFNLYFTAICIFFHSLIYFFENEKLQLKTLTKPILQLIVLGIVGLLLSSFQSLSNVFQLIESPRVSGDFSYASKLSQIAILSFEKMQHYSTLFLRSFSPDMLGSAENYRGWNNYMEAPVLYCGLLALILIPQFFIGLSTKSRKFYLSITGLIFVIILFPYIRYAFWLFTGDYYRTLCLFIVILMLSAASKAFDDIICHQRFSKIALIISTIVLLAVIIINGTGLNATFDKALYRNVSLFLLAESLLLFGLNYANFKKVALILLLIVGAIETIYMTQNTIYERKIVEKREIKSSGYNDATKEAITYLKSIDKDFYRVEKNYSSGISDHLSFNDAHIQGYYGSRSYHSFNQVYYVNFLKKVGLLNEKEEFHSRWLEGLMYAPYLQRLCSIKYYLTKLPNVKDNFKGLELDSLTTFEDVKVLKVKYALPMGVGYDNFITETDFDKLATQQKRKILLKAVVVDATTASKLKDFNRISNIENSELFDARFTQNATNELRKDTLSNLKVIDNQVSGQITLQKPRMLFLSIPYDKGWNAEVNGSKKEIIKIDIGLIGIILEKGLNKVNFVYETPFLKTGIWVSVITLLAYIAYWWFSSKRKELSKTTS